MATLKQIAQMAMDLYYRDYKSDDQFFDLEHFAFLSVGAYVGLVNEEGVLNKAMNRQQTGVSFIEISPDWIREEEVKVEKKGKRNIARLKYKVFAWDFDAMASGIQRVVVDTDSPCSELQKISQRDLQYTCFLPLNSQGMYAVMTCDELHILCDVEKVTVYYVPLPSIDNMDLEIHEDKQNDVIREVINLMLNPAGTVVDKSNDSNPNAVPAGELNPTLTR